MASSNNFFFVVAIFICGLLSPLEAQAQRNTSNVVTVCNKGNVDLSYIVFATKSSFLGGEEAKISGWHKIKRGKCGDVNPRGFQGVMIGFLQKNKDGIVGNQVYHVRNVGRAGKSKREPTTICAPINGSVDYKSTLGAVRAKYLPPCRDGYAEVEMSFYVKPNDIFPTINLKPRNIDRLRPWLSETATVASRPSQSSGGQNSTREMSGVEILGKVLFGAAKGLEDAQIKKLSSSCKNSALTFVFSFSTEGPAATCQCLSRKIVRLSGPNVVSRIVEDIDAGRDFDDAIDIVPEDKLNNYLESCISSPGAAASSPSNGASSGTAVGGPAQEQPKPELTLEQQAAALFPDPVKPSYLGEPEYDNPEPTRRIQGYMKRWEQLTGKNFLTDHWSMKPREGRNERGILTKPTTGNGEWPNIVAAYSAAEQTILNSYKTEWYRVATVSEMQQCVRPPTPKKPRACSDPERSFMIPECFQTSNWQEPNWCSKGHERNFHMTSNAKLEHGGQASYGNVIGDCLVKADNDGSPFVETRNNGKKIRGYFFKDNLLKNAFLAVECGQEWRSFSTAVYDARTDQEFVAANPLSVIIRNMNDEAARNMDAYNMKTARVIRQREHWIAQERSR